MTTRAPEAQRWYNVGLAHLHSFAWIEAAQAFNAALRIDPTLAMAHLGVSFAAGGLGSSQGALAAVERARTLSAGISARERLRIDLRQLQLDVFTGALPAARYVAALDRALASAPLDVELLLLRGEAADAELAAGGRESGAAAIVFFQRAQRAAPEAFAPRHFLAHAYENSGQVELALAESQAYVVMAPAVAHAHHMVGHSLRRTGRTDQASAQFEQAENLARAALDAAGIPPAFDWHTHHNTALLAAAYRYVGRLAAAEGRLAPAFRLAAPLLTEELNKRDWPALLLVRGRAGEAMTAAQELASHRDPIVRAAGHLSAAHVHLAAGRGDLAATEADAALRDLRQGGPAASVLAPDLRLVQGVVLLHAGERDRGRTMVRDAVASWRSRSGPDAWSETLFSIEAARRFVRAARDTPLAAELAEALQQHDPGYAGTSFAMAETADERGDRVGARAAYTEALARWRAADADHPDVRAARARLAALP